MFVRSLICSTTEKFWATATISFTAGLFYMHDLILMEHISRFKGRAYVSIILNWFVTIDLHSLFWKCIKFKIFILSAKTMNSLISDFNTILIDFSIQER